MITIITIISMFLPIYIYIYIFIGFEMYIYIYIYIVFYIHILYSLSLSRGKRFFTPWARPSPSPIQPKKLSDQPSAWAWCPRYLNGNILDPQKNNRNIRGKLSEKWENPSESHRLNRIYRELPSGQRFQITMKVTIIFSVGEIHYI